jgi:alpha-1,6-mannosyltransferase
VWTSRRSLHVAPPARRAGRLRLVHLGRLSREQSPHLAVATAVTLHEHGVAVHLDVLGDGPHRGELVELAGAAPVTFHGHLSDRATLSQHIARHRTVGLPRRDLRLAVLDALACGTPVVTADVGGARELVDDHSGWWATPYPQALAHAVLRLAARPVAARRAAARRRAEQFPWTSTVEAMLDLHRGGAPGEGTHTTCSA